MGGKSCVARVGYFLHLFSLSSSTIPLTFRLGIASVPQGVRSDRMHSANVEINIQTCCLLIHDQASET